MERVEARAAHGVGIDLLLHRHAALSGELAHGLAERHALLLHHEREGVPLLAAAEAVVVALLGVDDEARRLLAVEGAAGLVVGPAAAQLHAVRRNQVGKIGPGLDLVEEGL